MAENETLDLWDRDSKRWQRVLEKIKQGCSPAEAAAEAVRSTYKTFQNLHDLFSKQGLSLAQFLQAAERKDGSLGEMVGRCREGRKYAELLQQLAPVHQGTEKLIHAMVVGTVDCFLEQMGVDRQLVGSTVARDAAWFDRFRRDVHEAMEPDVAPLAERLARQPDVKPRMPPRSSQQKDRDHAEELHTSLLPARRGT